MQFQFPPFLVVTNVYLLTKKFRSTSTKWKIVLTFRQTVLLGITYTMLHKNKKDIGISLLTKLNKSFLNPVYFYDLNFTSSYSSTRL